jgi:hypothetical protein
MDRYEDILKKAYNISADYPLLWPAGFLQILCPLLAMRGARLFNLATLPQIFWSMGLLALFSLASVVMWLQVQAVSEKKVLQISLPKFAKATGRVFVLALLGIAFYVGLKVLHLHWTVFALLASLFNATLVAAMFSTVLFGLNLKRSLWVALDLWSRKPSFISGAAFLIIISNGFAYYLAHAFWPKARESEQFSFFKPSATMWVLVSVLAVVAAFFASLLNAFLVLLFLEVMRPKKDPETVKILEAQPAVNPVAGFKIEI